jgi:hypothetical protein
MKVTDVLEKHLGDCLDWFSSKFYPPKSKIEALIQDLERLRDRTPDDYYTLHCLSDAYFILGDYERALDNCPLPEYEQKWSLLASRRMNLKLLIGRKCMARDFLTLFRKRVTKYGLENVELVAEMLNILVDDWENEHGETIVEHVVRKYSESRRQSHRLFNGTIYSKTALNDIRFYDFMDIGEFEAIVRNLTRRAENIVREEKGLPKVGEGWIAETKLYYEIKEYLRSYEVVHHGSPDWLGKQHLDIYVPELCLALEYQGLQHDEPVNYFGGQDAFEDQLRRDRRKSNLCKRHGVEIIYVREGYDINSLKAEINRVQLLLFTDA